MDDGMRTFTTLVDQSGTEVAAWSLPIGIPQRVTAAECQLNYEPDGTRTLTLILHVER